MPEFDDANLPSVQQAIRIIDEVPVFPRATRVRLHDSLGLRLAADLFADRDYPPFTKSLMDGYAVRSADLTAGQSSLRVVGTIAAGKSSDQALQPGQAMAIMTGAPLPTGADGIVPVEDVARRVPIGEMLQILRAATPGRYIGAKGSDCAAGQRVLARGSLLGPAQIAILASIGAAEVECFARPRVAILGTGDEVVPVDQTPTGSQIRDSNTHMLAALLTRLGCEVAGVETVRDDPDLLRAAIRQGMTHDSLFITGGMSMGEFDYVPKLLVELGMDLKISKLRIKPGKPFVFAVGEDAGFAVQGSVGAGEDAGFAVQSSVAAGAHSLNPEPRTLTPPSNPERPTPNPAFIFGLPGNPVSAFICTLRLASRLLCRMAGGTVEERWLDGRLDAGLPANGPREFYQPALRHPTHGQHSAHAEFPAISPLKWKGSADLLTLAAANCLIVRGENAPALPMGTVVRVLEI